MIVCIPPSEIIAPYNFDYALKHYNIYPWGCENTTLTRILRLQSGISLKVEIQSIGTIEKPKLVLTLKSEHPLTNQNAEEVKRIISWCLGLQEDLTQFYERCQKDPVLKAATEDYYGGRGKAYPTVFESIIGVICAQNIVFQRLYTMMYNLCKRFGDKLRMDDETYYTFPTPEQLVAAPISEIRDCGVGYRDKYIKGVAETIVKQNIDTESFNEMPNDEVKRELLKLPGVGEYTANLVLSVGLRRRNVFHLDSYIRKAMYTFYFDGVKVPDAVLLDYAHNHWSGFESLVANALTTNTEIGARKLGKEFRLKSGARKNSLKKRCNNQ
jgi:3-methyladenine DNA glycosylase/8-oxoguanine DNA glycosylase